MREKIFFLLSELFSPGFKRGVFRASSSAGREDRLRRFKEIYRYAFSNVPFYNKKYRDAGLSIDAIRTYDDIKNVPFLTKDELVNNRVQGAGKTATTLSSGGTSGIQVTTALDKNCVIKRYQKLLSLFYSIGWRLGQPNATLYPQECSVLKNSLPLLSEGRLRQLFFDFIQQYLIYGFFHGRKSVYYDESLFYGEPAGKYLDQLFKRKPVFLLSRPDILNSLLRKGLNEKRVFKQIEKIILVGNVVSVREKENMEKIFKSKVFNLYASTELGYVGFSCRDSGTAVHVDEENYLLEVVSEHHPEIVVSDFNNYLMPLIRYQTGDTGRFVQGHCKCGMDNELLEVYGRKDQAVLNDNGDFIYENMIIDFFEDFELVHAYQIVRDDDKINIIVRPSGLEREYLNSIAAKFIALFKINKHKVAVDSKTLFKQTPSGKLPIIT